MIFSSPIFLFLFVPIFFGIYFFVPTKWKNLFILIASIIFYAWGEPTFVWVALGSALIDWLLSKLIWNAKTVLISKLWLSLSIVLNLGLLFYFKYFNFFIDNVNHLLTYLHLKPLGALEVALPLAISFITFEKITYVVDVFRKVGHPAKSLLDYFTYVLIFPKLIAGPIIKYHDIESQIQQRTFDMADVKEGFFRFTKGLFKKVFIADTMAEVVDYIFSLSASQLGFLDAWIGTAFFTIQIYFDFSGYSDMAIGLLRVMGFRIMENFNLPYISKSFSEFWRRWHISLSTFIKDYLYIPLGGNRCSKPRQYFNLIVCFLLSGIWHGASWIFVLWGLYHGMFLTIDKALGIKPNKERKMPVSLQIIITFVLVMFSWAIFRSQSVSQLITFISAMFNPSNNIFSSHWMFTRDIIFMFILGIIISFVPATEFYKNQISNRLSRRPLIKFCLNVALLMLVIGKISVMNFVTFIYFRF